MYEQIAEALKKAHNPELAKHSMVYQLWHDGEITLTKGGELLGMRNLHMIVPGVNVGDLAKHWTESMEFDGKNHYIYCEKDDAERISKMIYDTVQQNKSEERLESDFRATVKLLRDKMRHAAKLATQLDEKEQEQSGGKSGNWYIVSTDLELLENVGARLGLHGYYD